MSLYDHEKDEHFIYGLIDPREGKVRYVGVSMAPSWRLGVHISESMHGKKGARFDWIRKILKAGWTPRLKTIRRVIGKASAFKQERETIFQLSKTRTLLNNKIPKALNRKAKKP